MALIDDPRTRQEQGLPIPGAGTAPEVSDDVKLPLTLVALGGGVGMLVDADGIPVVGDDGMPILRNMETPAGGGAGRTQFASERERDLAAAELARTQAGTLETREERAARLRFDEEQAELDREALLQRERMGVLSGLFRDFVGAQSQARDTLANLQPDPFRFAAVSGGIAPFGTTPQQGFQQQLQQFAGAAVPTADPNASAASLQTAIAQLQGVQAPTAPIGFQGGVTGMAGGGFIPKPPPGQVVDVVAGEGGKPEFMRITAQGVEFIPQGKASAPIGMQEGGFLPFQPIPFDKETLLPALGTSGIFSSLGFSNIPGSSTVRHGGNILGGRPGGIFTTRGRNIDFSVLQNLGVNPGLVRFGDDKAVFFRNPATGQLQVFSDRNQFTEAGFNFENVVNLQDADKSQFEFGPKFKGAPISTEPASPFTPFSAPIIEPTTGTQLPAPFTIASQLNKLRLTDPFIFNMLLSAYEAAGVPATDVLATVQAALPFGQERGAIGLR